MNEPPPPPLYPDHARRCAVTPAKIVLVGLVVLLLATTVLASILAYRFYRQNQQQHRQLEVLTGLDLSFRSFTQMYPGRTPIVLAGVGIDPKTQNATLRFFKQQPFQFFFHGRELPIDNNSITIPLLLADPASPAIDQVQVISDQFQGYVKLTWFPKEYYRQAGLDVPGLVVIHTNLPRIGTQPLPPAKISRTDAAEITQWIGPDQLNRPPADLAFDIMRRLIAEIDKHNHPRAAPGESRSGWELLREIKLGMISLKPRQKTHIARDFLGTAGLSVRILKLEAQKAKNDTGIRVQWSSDYTTTEIRLNDRWCWFDLNLKCLYAKDQRTGQILSVWELMQLAQSPQGRKAIRFAVYNPKNNTLTLESLNTAPAMIQAVDQYFTADKTIELGN